MSKDSFHTLSSHAEVAAAALGSVYAANELGKALNDENNTATDHYLKASVGAAVAVGAWYRMHKKIEHTTVEAEYESASDDEHSNGHGPRSCRHSSSHANHNHPHHTRHLLEEAAGAYSLGKELLGDDKHHVAHLIGEAMGAVGLLKDIQYRRKEITDVK